MTTLNVTQYDVENRVYREEIFGVMLYGDNIGQENLGDLLSYAEEVVGNEADHLHVDVGFIWRWEEDGEPCSGEVSEINHVDVADATDEDKKLTLNDYLIQEGFLTEEEANVLGLSIDEWHPMN